MDFLYFLVKSSKSWEPHYHQNFFIEENGFLYGVIAALIIGVIGACAFYFGCCNSKKSSKYANLGVWAIALLLCGVVGYFYADFVVIGDPSATDNTSVFRAHSFYNANDKYFIQQAGQPGVTETVINDLTQTKNQIKSDLDKGGDVRFEYDITTALLAILFYFLTSIFVKRFTYGGKTIPFMKP